ncbi:hypothetical protein LOTGIDRAFT_171694 [Lottia gigantea]|uniref:Major facilitator superfamily (MFS) profile domain-containing protein n=1 Tax=Lottia gigantea TaxID=225164 RepID=V4AGN9_LOTGI|nr:hypothetical protein LOTGIDRAFT_171694 [Lottia gigantea]ESP03209.1 hypothetical protein LOTGIDRAFT_171694 [Lottia gigantea]
MMHGSRTSIPSEVPVPKDIPKSIDFLYTDLVQSENSREDSCETRKFKLCGAVKRPIHDWLLLIACCLCNGVLVGYTYGIAVLFLDMKETFKTNRAEASLVQSVNTGFMFGGGIISSFLISYLSTGTTCIISAVIAAIATSSGFYLEALPFNILTVGFIGGFSLCNIFTSLFTVVGRVFKTNYNMAITCLILGGGVGSAIFPYFNLFLLETYGWRGTFLILSAVILNCLPLGLFVRFLLPPLSSVRHCDNRYVLTSHKILWMDPVFTMFILCLILRSVPIGLVSYFILDIADFKTFDVSEGSFFLSVVGFGNLSGRFLTLLSRPIMKFSAVREYAVYVCASGVAIFCLGVSHSYALIIVSCVFFGIAYGMISATAGVACFAISGDSRYPTAIGIFNTAMGVGFGLAGPIGGTIRDHVNSYDLILYGFASVSFLAGLLLMTVSCCCTRSKSPKIQLEDA